MNLGVTVLLFLLPWAVALVKVRHHHLDSGAVGLAATFSLGLPALWLAVVAYWATQRDADKATGPGLTEIADGLASRLRSQWETEAEARGLNDPYPLPVSWTAADQPLAGDLDALKTLAASGAGWSASGQERWAKGPEDLAGGSDRKLADVLAAVPTGRLVVLGEPGTGKTMLMVGLVLDLLHPGRRSSGAPIPVLAPLASWDPVSQDLHSWLGGTLITDYPDLAAAPPPGSAEGNRFETLLKAGLILPVLDGLDEIPESARAVAISRINRELKPGEQVVVTCRTEQYRAAVSPQDGQGVVLRAAVVQLSTLQFDEIASYLRQDAGPAAVTRWNFLNTLSPESPARQALITPLMAGLARAIYNPRPDEQARDLRHPAELCNFGDRPTIEAHLFDAYIPAAYRPPSADRWTAKQAEPWFVFLARHLEYTIGSTDLAWWQLQKAAPRTAFGLVAGLGSGLMAGLICGLGFGLRDSVKGGLVFGLSVLLIVWIVAGVAVAFARKTPARGARVTAGYLIIGVLAALFTALVLAFFFGHNLFDILSDLALAVWAGLGVGFAVGIQGESGDLARAINFEAVLARDRHVTVLLMLSGLTVGLAGGLALGLAAAYQYGPVTGFEVAFTFGFPIGLAVAAVLSLSQTMWPSYAFARGWLALQHRLPRHLVDFLADAHRRGVLRQVGAVYQFRHIELQHRLARTSGKIGFYYDFQNASGEKYWVSLVKVIDPAQSPDPDTAPGNGMRFVGAVFAIVGSSPQGEDVNGDAAAIASDGQICSVGLNDIAGYTNLGNRPVHVAQGEITATSVTFQVPEGIKVIKIQWSAASGSSSTAQWNASR